jgi:hypothetical protein
MGLTHVMHTAVTRNILCISPGNESWLSIKYAGAGHLYSQEQNPHTHNGRVPDIFLCSKNKITDTSYISEPNIQACLFLMVLPRRTPTPAHAKIYTFLKSVQIFLDMGWNSIGSKVEKNQFQHV